MATKVIYVTGPCKWARVYKPDEKYGNYSIEVYPDKASMVALAESGIQVSPKEDEEGIYYKFRRDDKKLINNELVEFGPPKVVDKDLTAFDKLIGNTSNVTLKISVYDTKTKGKGHRLEMIRVNNLVEYEPPKKDENAMPEAPDAVAETPKVRRVATGRPF